ncbi:MAG TPA: hypothetical protein VGD18_05870, partial [Thiobacillaceae bacterium]
SLMGAASLFLAIPASLSATPGMGWDVFYTGEGEPISGSYQRTPATGNEGKGFDVFNVGDGVKVDDFQRAYMGTSMGSEASDGWDVFRVGEGDPLP